MQIGEKVVVCRLLTKSRLIFAVTRPMPTTAQLLDVSSIRERNVQLVIRNMTLISFCLLDFRRQRLMPAELRFLFLFFITRPRYYSVQTRFNLSTEEKVLRC